MGARPDAEAISPPKTRQALAARSAPSPRLVWLLHWAWLYAALVVSIHAGRQHDYFAYIEQWTLVLTGGDPWASIPDRDGMRFGANTYGPLHNLLAAFLPFHPLAPKIVILLVFGVAATLLLRRLLRERGDGRALLIYALAVPGNMLVSAFGFGFGSNDLLVAAFVVFAILARLDRRSLAAGFWLGLAILLKLYPLLFVPLFMVERRRIDVPLGMATAAVVLAGMAAAYAVWGDAVLGPFRAAAGRDPSFLSIFVPLAPLDAALGGALNRTNAALVALVAVAAALHVWRRDYSWLSAVAIVILAALLAYKVGHQQFFMPWACAVAALPLLRSPEADGVALSAIPFLLFLSAFSLLHALHQPFLYRHEALWPFLAFPAGLLSLVLMLRVRPDAAPQSAADASSRVAAGVPSSRLKA